MSEKQDQLNAAAKKIGIGAIRRHVLLCVGDKCCTDEVGHAAWEKLKQKLKDVGLSAGDAVCQRTRAGCLRICCHGPVMVVYPEGVWYHEMTVDKIDRLVNEHLIAGKPIEEWIFARNAIA
ncbi:MAG: (2Fe-2S) ferredoxin domain-containing protein [Gemmataceae bacterium]|nr:(2Fe-2S) ferredoxin domain-containing protein [Gemmataceae bacterium]